jgi:low temperature requirement protein LtrA
VSGAETGPGAGSGADPAGARAGDAKGAGAGAGDAEGAGARAGEAEGAGAGAGGAEGPLRVSTLELFFDLVFAFAITQLTGVLSHDVTVVDGVRVLLIFGALWWMYGGYVWLSNARTPARTQERLLMLLGMAGYLIVGLAIPHAFGRDGVALGIGYLIVVLIHGWLYRRVNRNIARVVPFNVAAALLIIGAGVVQGWGAYALWAAALAVEQLSPLITRVRGRFDIAPSHFVERHGALIIVVFGESVVDIGTGAEGHRVTVSLALSAVLGLALVAALWWAYFGVGDDERAEQAMLRADPAARPALALAAYFFAYIPMLLGIVALASGVRQAIVNTGSTLPAGPCVALGCGVGLFLVGTAAFRHALGIGAVRYRLVAAAACLAASALGVTVNVSAEMAVLTLIVAAALIVERRGTDSVEA